MKIDVVNEILNAKDRFQEFVYDVSNKLDNYYQAPSGEYGSYINNAFTNATKDEMHILFTQAIGVIVDTCDFEKIDLQSEAKRCDDNLATFNNDVHNKVEYIRKEFGVNVNDLKKNIADLRSDFNNKVVFLTRKYGIALEPRGFRFGVEKATIQEEETYYKSRNYEPLPFSVNGSPEENAFAIVDFKIEKHNEVLERFGLDKDTPYGDPLKMKYTDAGVFYKENLNRYSPFIALKFL